MLSRTTAAHGMGSRSLGNRPRKHETIVHQGARKLSAAHPVPADTLCHSRLSAEQKLAIHSEIAAVPEFCHGCRIEGQRYLNEACTAHATPLVVQEKVGLHPSRLLGCHMQSRSSKLLKVEELILELNV